MFPPLYAGKVFKICAQTLEAFENGYIDADDEIDDLNITLLEKGVQVTDEHRFLKQPELSHGVHMPPSSFFAKRKFEEDDVLDDRRTQQLQHDFRL